MRAAVWLALGALVALPLRAEIYRCEGADGVLHFTGDPSACEGAVEHAPRGTLQRPGGGDPPADAADPVAAADPEAPGPGRRLGSADLAALFAPVAPSDWEVVHEAPESAAGWPDLRERGLRGSQARHYTRARGPVSEVCTVEIWVFENAAQAAAAGATLERDDWLHLAEGALLVLAHGVRLERHVGSRQGLVPGCEELAARTRERARRAVD